MRISNKDILPFLTKNSDLMLQYHNIVSGRKATDGDAEKIKQKLREVFDARVGHLPNEDEIRKSIGRDEFCIYENDNKEIVSLLQRVVQPKKFYINQVYNAASKEVIHSIMLDELIQYAGKGGKYVYAWVEETNIASIRFHKKYGLEQDGLWTIVYVRNC